MMKFHWFIAQLSKGDLDGLPQGDFNATTFANILKLVFGLAGGIALLIVTIAGFKYVISRGEPQEIAKAKDTILYALIGLVVCIFAFAIVSFVVTKL